MFSVAEAAAWKLRLQLRRPASISNGFSLSRVWSGSLEQEVYSSTSWSSLPFCSSHNMPGRRRCTSHGRSRLCGLSLVSAPVGTGSRGSCWGLAALESQAGCLSCCWSRRGASSALAAGKSHLLSPPNLLLHMPWPLSQQQFSRFPAQQSRQLDHGHFAAPG